MAEFGFGGILLDSQEWLQLLVDDGRFELIRADRYVEPAAGAVTCESLLEDPLMASRRYFLLRSEMLPYTPIVFGPRLPTGEWEINVTGSGPSLSLALPLEYLPASRRRIGRGSLYYEAAYQSPETGEWHRPPDVLKRVYNDLRYLLRRHMVRRFARCTVFRGEQFVNIIETMWLGRHAAALVDRGEAEVLTWGEWLGGDAVKSRKEDLPPVPLE